MNFGQYHPRLDQCITCKLEIFPPNSLRGYGNYQQYCQCVKVQRPAGPAKGGITQELIALRAFVREVSQQDPAQVPGQRQSNKERAEDLCEQWGIE